MILYTFYSESQPFFSSLLKKAKETMKQDLKPTKGTCVVNGRQTGLIDERSSSMVFLAKILL